MASNSPQTVPHPVPNLPRSGAARIRAVVGVGTAREVSAASAFRPSPLRSPAALPRRSSRPTTDRKLHPTSEEEVA